MIGDLTRGSVMLIACLFITPMAYAVSSTEDVHIEGMTSAGNGCTSGSTATIISADRKAFTIIFDQFIAETGDGVAPEEGKKYCRITLDLSVPQGWSYTLHEVTHRGFISIKEEAQATHRRTHWLGRIPFKGKHFRQRFDGPFDSDYMLKDDFFLKILSFGCGRTKTMNIDVKIGLKSQDSSSEGIITVDSIDGRLIGKKGVSWKRCDPL